jgi:nucleotidyltransferase/DNA polymerase involved in DNA repair
MPGFIGRRLCPELVFVKPNFQKYTRAAAATRAIFMHFDPEFEAGSLDEAYLDITDYCRSHETTGANVHFSEIPDASDGHMSIACNMPEQGHAVDADVIAFWKGYCQ